MKTNLSDEGAKRQIDERIQTSCRLLRQSADRSPSLLLCRSPSCLASQPLSTTSACGTGRKKSSGSAVGGVRRGELRRRRSAQEDVTTRSDTLRSLAQKDAHSGSDGGGGGDAEKRYLLERRSTLLSGSEKSDSTVQKESDMLTQTGDHRRSARRTQTLASTCHTGQSV